MTDKDYTCEDWGTETEWTQIKVKVSLDALDDTIAVMNMVSNYLQIEDYSDIDLKTCYGDLIDEAILNADKTVAYVSVYQSADGGVADTLAFLRERFDSLGIKAEISVSGVNEEDWANSWKAYYKPIKIGEKIVIVPAWEKYSASPEEIVVRMDPGMAFGTGTHETTRLVIKLLEKYVKNGARVADVGCGSGILAICASKLGAGECKAYDIDPVAVKVANENIKDSGLNNVTCEVSDLLKQVDRSGGAYDVICANIVADIIIRMMPDVGALMDENSVILASGIIVERSEDVISGFEQHGFKIVERIDENGWCALAVMKK
ncbi:MAG: 50S ribosomal protein L11 methyltransferase [Clostridia bacterium]|nr:50S ribosomal protein L11 methyltransferase [Clostridia bacterium]MBR2613158.1 50S ribosomal protein L11 methyltransferase [Clostridia bacterium]